MSVTTLTPRGQYVHATTDGATTLCGKPAGADRPDFVEWAAGLGLPVEIGADIGPQGIGRFECLTCARLLRKS